MSDNLPVLPDSAPSYLAELIKSNPAAAALNESMLANMSTGMPPLIGTNGTRFVVKEGGESNLIMKNGEPVSTLAAVIVGAKIAIEKKYYASNYDPKAEPGPPDCQSTDGIRPDAGCPNKQAEACAGCWANVFGSGTNEKGEATNGKACSDLKKLAIFANGKIYGFYVPPGSLKSFTAYAKDLNDRGIPAFAVITAIGFDLEVAQKLTFKYVGMLDPQKQLPKIIEMVGGKEVKEQLEFKMPTSALPDRGTPNNIPQQEAQQAPPEPPPTRAKGGKKKEEPKPETPQPQQPALDLGLGEDPAPAVQTNVAAENVVIETEATNIGPSTDDLASALGIDL